MTSRSSSLKWLRIGEGRGRRAGLIHILATSVRGGEVAWAGRIIEGPMRLSIAWLNDLSKWIRTLGYRLSIYQSIDNGTRAAGGDVL